MLNTKNISFRYNNQQELSFPDIVCDQGEEVLLLGQSGCGKTTLLHIMAGLRKPNKGEVIIDGVVINKMSNKELDRFRGQHIGLIFQTSHFIKSLTVGENVAMAQSLAGKKVNYKEIEALLKRLNIGAKLNKKTYELSQGEQQRVAIARAIINKPKLILADEPTSALDDDNTIEVLQLLREQAQLVNASLIIVTHDNRLKDQFTKRIEL